MAFAGTAENAYNERVSQVLQGSGMGLAGRTVRMRCLGFSQSLMRLSLGQGYVLSLPIVIFPLKTLV